MSTSKVLTILIPVYNGEKFLGGLLESFSAFVAGDTAGSDFLVDCEILVINNRSEDTTLDIARSYESKIANLRIVTPDTHVHSAEENVFRALKMADGEFTWVLGCDDIVRFEVLPEVIQIARDGIYDIAIFNFMQSDKDGRLETFCNYYMKDRFYEGDLVDFTQRMGFWWLIAGFSGQIVRTAVIAGYDHSGLVSRTSPIYSHVTAYLECFAGRPAAIVNLQNVVYRLSDNDTEHWRDAAGRLGVFDEYFWTLGYIRQIKHLENQGVVARDFLIKMIESNRSGFFRPTIIIYDKIIAQMNLMNTLRNRGEDRNKVSPADFSELLEFFEQRDLLARPFLAAMRAIYDAISQGQMVNKSAFDRARAQLESYRSSFLLAANFVGIEADYEIYRISNTFYAVHRYFRGALLERIRYLGQADQVPIVLTGRTRDALAAQISQRGIGLEMESVPPSLMRYCSQPIRHGAQDLANTTKSTHRMNSYSASFDHRTALNNAQQELTEVYKSRLSYAKRFAAWTAVLGLKIAKQQFKAQAKRGATGERALSRSTVSNSRDTQAVL